MLTDRIVRNLEPPEPKVSKNTGKRSPQNRVIYDEKVRGFGVRITSAGARAFVVNYRASGRERRLTIGAYPDWSVVAAREEARRLKRQIDLGHDPMGDRHAERAAPTVAGLADRYITDHLPKKRATSQRDDRAMIGKIIIPAIGKLKVADVRHTDVDRLHQSMRKAPYRANRVIALLSKMMNLAVKWEMRPDNPCRGIEKFQEQKRQVYLETEEIARLTDALGKHPDQVAANAIRLILLTGCRSGEALNSTWSQFDLERGVWIKPSSHTKQRLEHRVPLSAPALELLSRMREGATGDYVFPGRIPGEPRRDHLKNAWVSLRKAADIEHIRIHDLRHTFASILASSGASLPLIGALLGHTQPGTTARYSHLFDDPLRKAANTVGAVVTGAESAEIVPLKGGAA